MEYGNFSNGWMTSGLTGISPSYTGGADFVAAGAGLPSNVPQNGAGGIFANSGLGMNLNTLNLGLSGLGTLANIWSAFQANKLAKAQFNYTKGVTDTNLNNQIQSYNTTLEDRINSRAKVEGTSQADADKYITDHKLTRSY